MLRRVYLDNSATTQVAPEVLEAMMPFLTENFGNPSSIHHFGQMARSAVDKARHQVAEILNARPNEIIFTSGGTESNNLAIRGLIQELIRKEPDVRPHIITSVIEHPAVKMVCEDLEKSGCDVTYLPCHVDGVVRFGDVVAAMTDRTVLISIMTANNEIGTLQPVAEIGSFVRSLRNDGRKIYFHTDAVQAIGKINVDVEEIGCDLLSLSAHKIHAPKGVGALFVRRGTRLHPQNIGGKQERGIRGGTDAVPQIVGLGKAAEMAGEKMREDAERLGQMRDRFETAVFETIPDTHLNGSRDRRVPNISNISFGSVEGEGLLINLDMQGIAVSTGSACSSGSLEPSPIIRALGREDQLARGAIRFSFGRYNDDEDVEHTLAILPRAVETLRSLAPPKR